MSLKKQICEAFCNSSAIYEVPIGFAVRSPYKGLNGETLIYYAREEGQNIRFEDDGSTIFDLETAGVDMSSSTRLSLLAELCEDHGVVYDVDEVRFRTEWTPTDRAGHSALQFLAFLLRVQDLAFTTRERTASTFKDDIVAAFLVRAVAGVSVETNQSPLQSLAYYTVDIVVRNTLTGQAAAVFPGTSEQKALEAILFSKELELRRVSDLTPFLVLEQAATTKVHRNTQAKAMNSNLLQMAAWDGGADEVVDKVLSRIGLNPPLPMFETVSQN